MKKKTVKKAPRKAPKAVGYTATAIILGKKYGGKGETVLEAIESLNILNCKGKCILTVTNGEYTRERVLMPLQALRLFSKSRLMREIALKNISQLF